MGDAVKTLWLSDITAAEAPYYQIVASASTEFRISATVGSGLVNVANSLITGDWSIYYDITDAGTVTFEYFLSWDGVTAIAPTSSADIITGVVLAAGERATGFSPVLAPWLGIRATETGGANGVNFEKLILTFH